MKNRVMTVEELKARKLQQELCQFWALVFACALFLLFVVWLFSLGTLEAGSTAEASSGYYGLGCCISAVLAFAFYISSFFLGLCTENGTCKTLEMALEDRHFFPVEQTAE